MKPNVKYFLKANPDRESWTGYILDGIYYDTRYEIAKGHIEGTAFYYENVLRGKIEGLELTRFEPKAIFNLQAEKI
jgi:hypothetical protein